MKEDCGEILVTFLSEPEWCSFILTGTHTHPHPNGKLCPSYLSSKKIYIYIKRTTPPFPHWAGGPNNTYKKLKWISVHPSPKAVTCSPPPTPPLHIRSYRSALKRVIVRGRERAGTVSAPLHQLIEQWGGPVGNEQCRQEIKEWGKGERKRAEVSKSRTATSRPSCRRGRRSAAGGRWRQSHPITLPSSSSFGMLFPYPRYTYCHALPPPFLIPVLCLFHLSHISVI